MGLHLDQIAHLAVGAQRLRTQNQTNLPSGKLRLQLPDGRDRGIVHAADAEEDLVGTAIVLQAVARETRVHLRVETFHRLQDADSRFKPGQRCPRSMLKGAGAPQRQEVIAETGKGKNGRDCGDCGG